MPCAVAGGQSTPVLTAAFLTALRMKGETIEELAGFARAMRESAFRFRSGSVPARARYLRHRRQRDRTFNISTVSAFVVAGAGVRVAKHGNRSITEQVRQRRRAGSPGRADARRAGGGGALDLRCRHRLPVRAHVSQRDSPRAARAAGTEVPHGVQLSGAADQSRTRRDAGVRHVVGRSGGEDRGGHGAARAGARLRGARIGRSRRSDDYGTFHGFSVRGGESSE